MGESKGAERDWQMADEVNVSAEWLVAKGKSFQKK